MLDPLRPFGDVGDLGERIAAGGALQDRAHVVAGPDMPCTGRRLSWSITSASSRSRSDHAAADFGTY
jgi:hypothetical protein